MNDKMIHDYLEGELNSAEQDLLFAELNRNPQMRDELDFQMKLNKIMEMDRNASNTPAELTASLFNRLNYSIPLANNAKLVSTPKRYFWRYAVAMLLLLFVSIPAGIMIYDNYQGNAFAGDKLNSQGNLDNKNTTNFSNDKGTIATINSNEVNGSRIDDNDSKLTKNSSGNSNHIKISHNYSATKELNNAINKFDKDKNFAQSVNNMEQSDINQSNSTLDENYNISIYPSQYEYNNYYFSQNSIVSPNSSSSFGLNLNPILNDILGLLSDKNFEININIKNSINNYPPSSLNITNNIYDNMDLSLWYNFDNGLNLGVEVGRESFNQSFTTSNGLIYNQIPTLNYIGIGVRYSAYQYELPLESVPFFQLKAAASTIGPIFNIQSGLTVASYSKISLRLGIEYSTLLYNVNSNIYNSGKVNLIGGLVYSF